MKVALHWAPAGILTVGAWFTLFSGGQREPPLRAPLDETLPAAVAGLRGEDREISEAERQVAGVTDYLFRVYSAESGAAAVSLYVGYYDRQTQGKTIHSPKNCLPGAGWEALSSRRAAIAAGGADVVVNRYILQRGDERALVLYWYQGRGRVEANEYVVKWDLLRDAALRGRSEEALVRLVVPIEQSEERAFDLAARVAAEVIPALYRALPG